jgi:hypothetical protein
VLPADEGSLTFVSLEEVHTSPLADHLPANSIAGICCSLIILHADEGVVVCLGGTILDTNCGSGGKIISVRFILDSRVIAADPTIVVDLIGQSGAKELKRMEEKEYLTGFPLFKRSLLTNPVTINPTTVMAIQTAINKSYERGDRI